MSDPTDPGGVGAAQERAGSRYARVGDNGSPVGSPLTIILAVVAVVVGFLIFRTIDSGSSSAGDLDVPDVTVPVATNADGSPVTTVEGAAGTSVAPTTTQPVDKSAADVVVINAAEVGGVAGAITDLIAGAGFSTVDAVSDADDTPDAETIVYFTPSAPASEAVANELAAALDVTRVEAAPADGVPLASGDSAGTATVFVWLGTDRADITELPGATTAPTTPPINTPPPTTASG